MTEIYRIHGRDNLGQFSIDCYSYEEFQSCYNSMQNESEIDDLWVEEYDEEEGWQA